MTDINVSEELGKFSRRMESMQKTVDLIMKDRDILEDILHRLGVVESTLNLNNSTAKENAKNAKADIAEVKDIVAAKVDEVNQTIDDKTVIVKSPKESVLQKIINKIGGGK